MWRHLETLAKVIEQIVASVTGAPLPEEPARPAVRFHEYYKYPGLFEFNLEKLDINLLIYPDTGATADADAALLLVYGCEEILRSDEINEAYICRKLGEVRDRGRPNDKASFEHVFADTRSFDAQLIVDGCVARGDLARVSLIAGGNLRLAAAARPRVQRLAEVLNRRA